MKKLVGLAVLCLLPARAHAWGKIGHQTVAVIAEDRLHARALMKVHEILGPNVGLEDVATCADDIKQRSVNCGGAFYIPKEKYTESWHFIDLPVKQPAAAADIQKYCRHGAFKDDCAPNQIRRDLAVLKDPAASRQDQQMALMFLVHLMGDVHQPLHCADDNDAGGNAKRVWFLGNDRSKRPMNLHHLWDNILESDSAEKKIRPRALASMLEKDINKKNVHAWLQGDPIAAAAAESYGIAKDVIYPTYHEHLDEFYRLEMQPIALEQIEKAGVRLADLLNQALSP